MTRLILLTSLFSILAPVFAEPEAQGFDSKHQAIEDLSAPAGTLGHSLFRRYLTCDAGYGYCSSNGGCCPSDSKCCLDGCGKPGSICCSTGGSCPSGWDCCGIDSCAPVGGECCGDGGYCDAGNICVKVAGYTRDQCCTDLKCTAHVSGGATIAFTTGGGYTKTYSSYSVTSKRTTTAVGTTATDISNTRTAVATSQEPTSTGGMTGILGGGGSGSGSPSTSSSTKSAATGSSTGSPGIPQQQTGFASRTTEGLFLGMLAMVGAGLLLIVGLL